VAGRFLRRRMGPAAGLALLGDSRDIDAEGYPYVHLVRGALLAEAGRVSEARSSLERAEQVARNGAEREQVRARLAALGIAG